MYPRHLPLYSTCLFIHCPSQGAQEQRPWTPKILMNGLSQTSLLASSLLSCAQIDDIPNEQLTTQSWGTAKVAVEDRDTRGESHAFFFNTNSVARAATPLQFINLWSDCWDHSTICKWRIATIFITEERVPAYNVMSVLKKVGVLRVGVKKIRLSHPCKWNMLCLLHKCC